jgi:hypothetical protein
MAKAFVNIFKQHSIREYKLMARLSCCNILTDTRSIWEYKLMARLFYSNILTDKRSIWEYKLMARLSIFYLFYMYLRNANSI